MLGKNDSPFILLRLQEHAFIIVVTIQLSPDVYNEQVCCEQFKGTYSIGTARLQNLRNQMQKGARDGAVFMSPKKDARGSHNSRANAVNAEIKAQINQMMYDLITKRGSPTHYGGRYRRDAIHLPSVFNVPLLWEMFHLLNDTRDPSYMDQIAAQREHPAEHVTLEPMIKLSWFRNYFNTHYGQIKFWRGKTDQCGTCAKLKEHIDSLKTLSDEVLNNPVRAAVISQVEYWPPIATEKWIGLIHIFFLRLLPNWRNTDWRRSEVTSSFSTPISKQGKADRSTRTMQADGYSLLCSISSRRGWFRI